MKFGQGLLRYVRHVLTQKEVDRTAPVRVERLLGFRSKALGRKVAVDVFLPPGHRTRGVVPYPVLYANDGQDMEAVKMRETLTRLYAEGSLQPLVVVAVRAADRLHEYGTAARPDYQGRGAGASHYARFVLHELMPYVNGHYHTSPRAAQTAVMGFSLGGLSAFDLAWNHPGRFGQVGVFSGSFWWRSRSWQETHDDSYRIAHTMVREGDLHPDLRFWFQAGTADEDSDRDGDGIIDAIGDTLHLMEELKRKGYADEAIRYVEVPGGRHDQPTWGQVLPDFLLWAFGRGGV
ncbi:MAG: alpha/beta hydrolase-fold protein [Catalinimonas sp.]